MRRPILTILFITLLTSAHAALAAPTAQTLAVPLSDTPLRVESIGLTMHLPEGASSRTDLVGTTTATRIELPGQIGHMAIQSRRTTNLELTPAQVCDGIIKGLAGAKVLDRTRNLKIGSLEADRFYAMPHVEPGKPSPVQGFTVVRPRPGQIVIFEIYTTGDKLKQARIVYETTVGTALFVDADKVAARRAAQVRAGAELIARMTPADFQAVIDTNAERWERLNTPSLTGSEIDADEHGYRRVRAWAGNRGDLNPKRPKERWSAQDKQPGYVLQIDALLLEPTMRIDSQAVYFLSQDREHESWTVRMAIREEGKDTTRWTEIGARDGSSMVIRIDPNQGSPTTIKPLIQGEGYISQFESMMLGPILVHAGIPADFAFYAYSPSGGAIQLRTDALDRIGGSDGPWKLTTRLATDAPTQTSYYTPAGEMLRLEQHDGRIWEPTQLKRLLALWEEKGLPID